MKKQPDKFYFSLSILDVGEHRESTIYNLRRQLKNNLMVRLGLELEKFEHK